MNNNQEFAKGISTLVRSIMNKILPNPHEYCAKLYDRLINVPQEEHFDIITEDLTKTGIVTDFCHDLNKMNTGFSVEEIKEFSKKSVLMYVYMSLCLQGLYTKEEGETKNDSIKI